MGTTGDGQLGVGIADTTYNMTAAPSLIPVMQTILPLNVKVVIQKYRRALPCLGHVIALKVRVEQSLFRCCMSCLLLRTTHGLGEGTSPNREGRTDARASARSLLLSSSPFSLTWNPAGFGNYAE